MTMSIARTQPIIPCGPAIAPSSSGIVMNGPAPSMFDTFSDVACSVLSPR
jgi:hypothetical protein